MNALNDAINRAIDLRIELEKTETALAAERTAREQAEGERNRMFWLLSKHVCPFADLGVERKCPRTEMSCSQCIQAWARGEE